MIVRTTPDDLLLITQPDHAKLAADVMAAWMSDGLPVHPSRSTILLAVREHDNGWLEEDVAPLIDPQSGTVTDFLHSPEDVRQKIWPRGIERLAPHPYAAALVAQHALSVYSHYRTNLRWNQFFAKVERLRRHFLDQSGAALADLLRDYFFVQMGDLLSLTFCSDWIETQSAGNYVLRWNGTELTITPDPFQGASIHLTIQARQMACTTFTTQQDAVAQFRAAPFRRLTGVARGA